MAEELVMTVKSNISTVTKDVKQLESSLDMAGQSFNDLTQQVYIQKTAITELELEYIRLQQLAISTPRTAIAGYPQLLEKIRETQDALANEKIQLKQLNTERRAAKGAMEGIAEGTDKSLRQNTSLIGSMTRLGGSLGGIKSKYLQIIPAAKKMFLAIKTGLVSTGYGAVIVALGAIIALMSQSDRVASGWGRTQIALGVALDVYLERVGKLAEMYVDLFTGDFAGAWENLKGIFGGLGDELEREISLAIALEEKQADLAANERALNVAIAEKGQKLDELNRIADDETRTQEDRIHAAEEAIAIEKGFMEQKLQNALDNMQIIADTIKLNGDSAKSVIDLANAEIQLANIRRGMANAEVAAVKTIDKIRIRASSGRSNRAKKREQEEKKNRDATIKAHNDTVDLIQELYYKQLKTAKEVELAMLYTANERIRKKTEAEFDAAKEGSDLQEKLFGKLQYLSMTYQEAKQTIIDKYDDKAKEKATEEAEALRNIASENMLAEIEDLETRALAELEIQKKKEEDVLKLQDNYAEMKLELDEKYNREANKIMDESLANEKAMNAAKVDSQLAAFSQLSGALSTLAGDNKELAAASAIIDTFAGANKAFQQGGVAGFVTGAAVVAAGLANVRAIYATDVGPDGGGPPPPAVETPPAPEMMSGAFTLGGGQAVEPARAYVVSDDITANQDKLAIIRRRATI